MVFWLKIEIKRINFVLFLCMDWNLMYFKDRFWLIIWDWMSISFALILVGVGRAKASIILTDINSIKIYVTHGLLLENVIKILDK